MNRKEREDWEYYFDTWLRALVSNKDLLINGPKAAVEQAVIFADQVMGAKRHG